MIQYRQITFKEAMEMIANDNLDNLYFVNGNGVVCIKSYRIDIDALKDKEYYRREVIEVE